MNTSSAPLPEVLPWQEIDTVLLDMDGTLLDLRFDNWFWQEHIPAVWGAARGLSATAAAARLEPTFRATMGTLAWYCIDHWSTTLGLDVHTLKEGVREEVRWLPGAEEFLRVLRAAGKRTVLVTNAHPGTLAVKERALGFLHRLDAAHSTHAFGAPKEDARFWPALHAVEPFDPARTVFVDDSLPMLQAATQFGIRHVRAVRCPDSGRGPKDTGPWPAVDRVSDLLAGLVRSAAAEGQG
ncbi:MAG: GMP/IMP nucleotidase [Gammaproteobacteria bacterium]